jgi:hypothetical protein
MAVVQLVSECVMATDSCCHCYYNTFSECLIDSLINSFHTVKQRSDLFFHDDRDLHKVCVCECSENFTLLGQYQAQETIKIQSVTYQS